MPLEFGRGHRGRAHGLPARRGHIRRQPPRYRPRRRGRRRSCPATRPSPTTSARSLPGRAQYTHLLDEQGSVLDDIIVWWVSEQRFDVMPNASNTSRVLGAIGGHGRHRREGGTGRPGPRRGPSWPEFSRRPRPWAISAWRRWTGGVPRGRGEAPGIRARTVSSAPCRPAWPPSSGKPSLAAGAVPAGLGARDTLRLEAGLPLHGHELGPGITPLEAGLSWVVAWDKPGGFTGRDALVEQRQRRACRVCSEVSRARTASHCGRVRPRSRGGPSRAS